MYRYRMLLPLGYANDPKNKDKSGQLDLFAVAKNILSKVPCPSDDGSLQWQLGKSKVFMKEAQARALNQPLVGVVVSFLLWAHTVHDPTERRSGKYPQQGDLGEGGDHPVVVAHGVDAQLFRRDATGRQAHPKRYHPACLADSLGQLTNWSSSSRRAQSCEGSSNGVDMLC